MTESRMRFLRAIADRVDLEHVAELYLFPPMRQGGSETGVAVVAVTGRPEAEGHAQSFVVFSARYRLILKGPDRGKWEAEMREEADAPLVTVDEVVRGVQRRAGEGQEAERLSGDRLRATLAMEQASVTPGSART